jgi:hypothetical protein
VKMNSENCSSLMVEGAVENVAAARLDDEERVCFLHRDVGVSCGISGRPW